MNKWIKSSMATKVFIDTSGFFALLVAEDPAYELAADWFDFQFKNNTMAFTSDQVMAEAATLFKARGYLHMAKDLFAMFEQTNWLKVEWINTERFAASKDFFLHYQDKNYSFTDCTSFVLMEELGLRQALTTDHHFRQAGFVPLLKSK
jgi:uncharacterized protein